MHAMLCIVRSMLLLGVSLMSVYVCLSVRILCESIAKIFPPPASPAIPDVPYQTPLQNVNVALSHVALNNGVVGEIFFNAPITCCVSEMARNISHSYNVTSIGSRMRSMEQ